MPIKALLVSMTWVVGIPGGLALAWLAAARIKNGWARAGVALLGGLFIGWALVPWLPWEATSANVPSHTAVCEAIGLIIGTFAAHAIAQARKWRLRLTFIRVLP